MTQVSSADSTAFFRIDSFNVSSAGREELLRRIQETHEVLRAQSGYVRDYILERTSSNEDIDILTFVEWDETTRPEAVRDAVRARHSQLGFDPSEMYERLRIEPEVGTYRQALPALQDGVSAAAQPQARRASGTYENDPADEVPFDDARDDASLKRATVRRRYSGDIEGTSVAHVTIFRATADRVGYVATDQFEGVVNGRRGRFVFQHGGSIDRGVLRPFGYIVPGSGTDALAGISGDVEIQFVPPATHTIALTYRLER